VKFGTDADAGHLCQMLWKSDFDFSSNYIKRLNQRTNIPTTMRNYNTFWQKNKKAPVTWKTRRYPVTFCLLPLSGS